MPPWAHFTRSELQCRCGCGTLRMDPDFMERVESLRLAYGKPLYVTSGYRCPEHNEKASKTGRTGPHTTGKAVDFAVSGPDARLLIGVAVALGFEGIGVAQKGPHPSRFIHLDMLGERIWSY